MKAIKTNKLTVVKYLRILTLLVFIVTETFVGVALLTSSHASTIYTVPDQRNATNPNDVIDPSGVKDSTAGLQAFLNSVPSGSSGNNNTVFFPAGAKYRVNNGLTSVKSYMTFTTDSSNPAQIFADNGNGPQAYPWRVRPTPDNATGVQSAWFMDEFGDLNNHATLHSQSCSGCTQGGFDGYLSGYQNDASIGDAARQHGFAVGSYYQHPFVAADVGKVITACSAFGCMNRIISGVSNCPAPADDNSKCSASPDASGHFNMVDWSAAQANQSDNINESSNGWVRWAINTSKGGWECYFTPNPSYNPQDYTGSFKNFNDATVCATDNNRGRIMMTLAGHAEQWLNIQIHGSNVNWRNSVLSFDNSEPAVTEFQHDMILGGNNNEVGNATIDNTYGDGIDIVNGTNEWIHNNRIEKTGRQGLTSDAANCNIIIENNVIQETHHSIIDFEPGRGAPAPGCQYKEDHFAILNNTIGGPHGFAANPGGAGGSFGHWKFDGNHSTNADVAAGTIVSTAPYQRTNNWGSDTPSDYLIFTNNKSDAISALGGLNLKNWSHVLIQNNTAGLQNKSYFSVFTGTSTDYSVSGNKESCTSKCNLLGQLDPTSTNAVSSFTFSPPGKSNADSWWANNGPDPANYYRDMAKVTPPPPDTTAPSVPSGLKTTQVTTQAVGLSWQASTDNVGVDHYNIYRQTGDTGTLSQIATTKTTTYSDTGVSGGTKYNYEVTAVDAAGNESNKSSSVSASVPAAQKFLDEDINEDGKVDILDFSLLIDSYGKTGSNLGRADINHDGKVDILDFSLLIDNYGK